MLITQEMIEFSMIWNDFGNSKIWKFHSRSLKSRPKNPEIQPTSMKA